MIETGKMYNALSCESFCAIGSEVMSAGKNSCLDQKKCLSKRGPNDGKGFLRKLRDFIERGYIDFMAAIDIRKKNTKKSSFETKIFERLLSLSLTFFG